jgi:allophanate hydrolase subunit 2
VLGPRADWFSEAALASLDGATYEVGTASNRIGLRLAGAALERLADGELPSEGLVLGAVQVPPNGQPVVLLHDHPTTGGYPVVAVVVGADLPVCAQARPGDRLTLRVTGRPGAHAAQDPRPRD